MVLELHVWGPAFGLPSIDAECIATIAYFNRIVPRTKWVLVADHDTSISPRDGFPVLLDGVTRATGFASIISHLRTQYSRAYDLDDDLSDQQQTNRIAFLAFLESTANPLLDLSLYISSENYNTTTSSAYTAILPWYTNYIIPPKRRDLARARTAHLGLSSLDVTAAGDERTGPGSGTASSEFEAAKRAAGIQSGDRIAQPKVLSMGRGKGIGGLLGSPIYAARFKLDALSNEVLGPLSDLLGKKDYLFKGDKPSSLDCLAFGYLALMLYPSLPQAWLAEAIQTRYPRLLKYIRRLREELLGRQEVNPADVWNITSDDVEIKATGLPWQPRPSPSLSTAMIATRELLSNLPLLSKILHRDAVIQKTDTRKISRKVSSSLPSPLLLNGLIAISSATTVALVGMAFHVRRYPREGELIFWALRPSTGFGEAGDILSALGQLPRGAARF